MSPLPRLALIGAGLIGAEVHLPRLVNRTDVEVAVIIDADRERARLIAQQHGVKHFSDDLDAVLADDQINIVDLCTPPTLHRSQVEASVRAGKDVILEKPLATTLSDAEHVARIVAAAPERTVMVAENWVYSSAGRALHALVTDGSLGDVEVWESRHESDHRLPSGGQPAWNYDLEASGGGYLMQAGTHAVSLGRRLFGEMAWVAATSPQATGDGGPFLDHDMVVSLGFRSGVVGSLVLSGRSRRPGSRVLSQTLIGTNATVDADILTGELTIGGASAPSVGPISMGFDEEFDHFFASRRAGTPPVTSAADQVETLRTVAAIYQSAACATRVDVEGITAS
ncbi:Gfo/Idh/MocA family oxidoreductase [Microbacterium marmarense]|uniref:Gfo/Idh/MocA family oxidoreductase n=1 Tax=Microbacterium marmarense TaxID=3122051 RepID=A0ABU8LQZ4_9MICO